MTTYFGIYCPQCNIWVKDTDGRLFFYPAAEIANAQITQNDPLNRDMYRSHLWQAQEFGAEKPVNPQELPAGAPLCPDIIAGLERERLRVMAM